VLCWKSNGQFEAKKQRNRHKEERTMKKCLSLAAVMALGLTLMCGGAFAGENGNGLPSGNRYMLNVIAYDNCPAGDFTDSNRHMIAVKADFNSGDLAATQAGTYYRDIIRTNTIALAPGADFQVIDGNACNKGGAAFQLPYPSCPAGADPTCTGTLPEGAETQDYRVFVRLVGAPKTGIGVTTCATQEVVVDIGTGATEDMIVCSTENVVRIRNKGKVASFEDVSKQLLTICLDTYDDGNFDGNCDVRYSLFSTELENYFWQWNTQGKAHAQLVFIPTP
jgi:hypothetical protein